MDMFWLVVNSLLSGVNLLFLLKIIFNDLRHLGEKIDRHIEWHLPKDK